jgi:hypothetical protein
MHRRVDQGAGAAARAPMPRPAHPRSPRAVRSRWPGAALPRLPRRDQKSRPRRIWTPSLNAPAPASNPQVEERRTNMPLAQQRRRDLYELADKAKGAAAP